MVPDDLDIHLEAEMIQIDYITRIAGPDLTGLRGHLEDIFAKHLKHCR